MNHNFQTFLQLFGMHDSGHTICIQLTVRFLPNAIEQCIVNGCHCFSHASLLVIQVSKNRKYKQKIFHIATGKMSLGVKSGNHVIIRAGTSTLFISQSCTQTLSNTKTSVRGCKVLLKLNSSLFFVRN